MELIKEIRRHVKAYNKYLTDDFLETLSPARLIGFCHPIYRDNYKNKLKKIYPDRSFRRTIFASKNG